MSKVPERSRGGCRCLTASSSHLNLAPHAIILATSNDMDTQCLPVPPHTVLPREWNIESRSCVGAVACHRTSSVKFHVQAVDGPNQRQINTEMNNEDSVERRLQSTGNWKNQDSYLRLGFFKRNILMKRVSSLPQPPTVLSKGDVEPMSTKKEGGRQEVGVSEIRIRSRRRR